MSESKEVKRSSDFFSLPTRIFLDSSVLQSLYDYGAFIWEGEEPASNDPQYRIPGGPEELSALQAIFFVNERALFEFALSANSVAEVEASGSAGYLQWAFDVLDHWEACLAAYSESPFAGSGETASRRLDSPDSDTLAARTES